MSLVKRLKNRVRRLLVRFEPVTVRLRELFCAGYNLLLLCIPYKKASLAAFRFLFRMTAVPLEMGVLIASAKSHDAKANYASFIYERRSGQVAYEFLAWLRQRFDRTAQGQKFGDHVTVYIKPNLSGSEEEGAFSLACLIPNVLSISLVRAEDGPGNGAVRAANSEPSNYRGGRSSVFRATRKAASLSDITGCLRVPEAARVAARNYLRQFCRFHPVIATSIVDVGAHDDSTAAHWSTMFQRVHERFPAALILLLNYHECNAPNLYPSYVRVPGVVGFGLSEQLALAQQADIYYGALNVFGEMAMESGKMGVYFSSSLDIQYNSGVKLNDDQVLLDRSVRFSEGAQALERILRKFLTRFMNPVVSPPTEAKTAHEFIKLWDQRDIVVAVNLPVRSVSLTSADAVRVREFTERIIEACPDAVICLLNVLTAGTVLRRIRQLWTTDYFGSTPSELLALARCADAYFGVLDSTGHAALLAGRPGVYAAAFSEASEAGNESAGNTETLSLSHNRQLITKQLDADLCIEVLRQLYRERRARLGSAV